MPPGPPTGWRVSDGLPFGSRIVCRCTHVPRVCVGPSADRCLGSRLRLCVTPPSTRYGFPRLPGAAGRSGQRRSGRLPPADAPSAGGRLRRAAPSTGERTRVRPASAACVPAGEAPPPAEGAFVAGGRRLTRLRWAAGCGRAGSGGRRCERAAVPRGCGCGQTLHHL